MTTTAPDTMNTIKKGAGRQASYSPDEDANLSRCWVSTSEDSETGTGQKGKAFWDTISALFNQRRTVGDPQREVRSLTARFAVISKDCSKFVGAMAQVDSLQPSGSNTDDRIEMALQLFLQMQKSVERKLLTCNPCWH